MGILCKMLKFLYIYIYIYIEDSALKHWDNIIVAKEIKGLVVVNICMMLRTDFNRIHCINKKFIWSVKIKYNYNWAINNSNLTNSIKVNTDWR